MKRLLLACLAAGMLFGPSVSIAPAQIEAEQVRAAIDRGVAYLKQQQRRACDSTHLYFRPRPFLPLPFLPLGFLAQSSSSLSSSTTPIRSLSCSCFRFCLLLFSAADLPAPPFFLPRFFCCCCVSFHHTRVNLPRLLSSCRCLLLV